MNDKSYPNTSEALHCLLISNHCHSAQYDGEEPNCTTCCHGEATACGVERFSNSINWNMKINIGHIGLEIGSE